MEIEDKSIFTKPGKAVFSIEKLLTVKSSKMDKFSFSIFSKILEPSKSFKRIKRRARTNFQFLLNDLEGKEDWKRSYIEFSPSVL